MSTIMLLRALLRTLAGDVTIGGRLKDVIVIVSLSGEPRRPFLLLLLSLDSKTRKEALKG